MMTTESIAKVKVALAARKRLVEAHDLAGRLIDELDEEERYFYDAVIDFGEIPKPRGRPPGSGKRKAAVQP